MRVSQLTLQLVDEELVYCQETHHSRSMPATASEMTGGLLPRYPLSSVRKKRPNCTIDGCNQASVTARTHVPPSEGIGYWGHALVDVRRNRGSHTNVASVFGRIGRQGRVNLLAWSTKLEEGANGHFVY